MPKVFVVDDDADIVYMVKFALEKDGHEVATFPNGLEALAAIKTRVPDLMVVDLSMPEMSGWRLCMKVREDERCKNVPIIVLSGLVSEDESEPAPSDPYNVLMAKPFEIFKLAKKVKELLKTGTH